jgi:hypothetical protein
MIVPSVGDVIARLHAGLLSIEFTACVGPLGSRLDARPERTAPTYKINQYSPKATTSRTRRRASAYGLGPTCECSHLPTASPA